MSTKPQTRQKTRLRFEAPSATWFEALVKRRATAPINEAIAAAEALHARVGDACARELHEEWTRMLAAQCESWQETVDGLHGRLDVAAQREAQLAADLKAARDERDKAARDARHEAEKVESKHREEISRLRGVMAVVRSQVTEESVK